MSRKLVYNKLHTCRNKNENYLTPESMIQQLIDNFKINKKHSIFEPCASPEKTIEKVLIKNGFTNITNNVFIETKKDFLSYSGKKYNIIITNPPYKNANSFLLKSFDVAKNYVIMLLPLDYLSGKQRFDTVYQNVFKLYKLFIFIRKPLLTNTSYGEKYNTGMTVYGWYIFKKNFKGNTTIILIDNNQFVIRKRT